VGAVGAVNDELHVQARATKLRITTIHVKILHGTAIYPAHFFLHLQI